MAVIAFTHEPTSGPQNGERLQPPLHTTMPRRRAAHSASYAPPSFTASEGRRQPNRAVEEAPSAAMVRRSIVIHIDTSSTSPAGARIDSQTRILTRARLCPGPQQTGVTSDIMCCIRDYADARDAPEMRIMQCVARVCQTSYQQPAASSRAATQPPALSASSRQAVCCREDGDPLLQRFHRYEMRLRRRSNEGIAQNNAAGSRESVNNHTR